MIATSQRSAVYLRVSTDSQNSEGQRLDVTRWLENHGIDPNVVDWYEDTDSRETLNRVALKRLQSAVFHGRVKTIVVADVTRLAGTIVDGINLLHGWLSQGVRLVSVRQEFDFSSTTGLMIASLLFGLSQSEMETRRQRQRAGIEAAKRRGVYQGRQKGTTKAEPERARRLRAQGLQVEEIATALGISRSTAARYLRTQSI
ncbi:MAG: recombinase family protein [Pirellulaceae bacterium]